jgi:zinc protease
MTRTVEQIRRTEAGPRPLPTVPAGPTPPMLFPDVVDTVLSNGLRLLLVPMSAVPMVRVGLQIPFGSADPRRPATAHMLSRTLFGSTSRRSRSDITTELNLGGGSLLAAANPQALSVSGWALSSGFDVLLDVLADVLTGAAYDTGEVTSEAQQSAQNLAFRRDAPGNVLREALLRRCYGDHPAGRVLPHADDVVTVTRDELLHLHATAVLPRGAALTVVGDVDVDRAVAHIDEAMAGWASEHSAGELEAVPEVTGGDLQVVHSPGATHSNFRLAAQGLPLTDPRYPALRLANDVFAGSYSSRLSEILRQVNGYTYSVDSTLVATSGGSSTITLATDTATDATDAVLREIHRELDRLTADPPSQIELDRARRHTIGSLQVSMASQSGMTDRMVELSTCGLDMGWLTAFVAGLDAVTTEEVAVMAQEFFARTNFTGVIRGDAEILSATLPQLGGVALP